MKFIRRIAWTAVAFTYFLVALGGTVRTTDSGLSCPDWPLCYGKAFATIDYHTFLEQFHRYVAGIVSVLVVTLAISAFIWARKERHILVPALIAPVLLVIQIVLGGLTVLWKLPSGEGRWIQARAARCSLVPLPAAAAARVPVRTH